MTSKVYRNIISLTSIAILAAVVFSCQIGLWNSIFPISLDTPHHQMPASSDCCQTDNNTRTSTPVTDSSGDIFTLPDNRLSFVVISFLFLLVSFNFLSKLRRYSAYNYLKNIRFKYGGFKLFHYFSHLFSSGILNPKVY